MFRITSVCSFTGIADRDYKTLLQKVTKYVETRGKTIEIKVDVECGFTLHGPIIFEPSDLMYVGYALNHKSENNRRANYNTCHMCVPFVDSEYLRIDFIQK